MNYKTITDGLSDYNKNEVNRYINYLQSVENEKDRDKKPKNAWIKYQKEESLIDIYKKVAIDNLSIDGETVTLQFKGKLMASYNYQAYKNKVLSVYPETKFDIQLVCDGDTFSFKKESGKVIYKHEINNPFNTEPKIIGTYCVIKNQRGEFLETLNMAEIEKMRNAAKTKNIWDEWFSEMVLKSVIKRACKRHFKDITTNIDNLDNENYDLDNVDVDNDLQKEINAIKTVDELNEFYRKKKDKVSDHNKFVGLMGYRKSEILQEQKNHKG